MLKRTLAIILTGVVVFTLSQAAAFADDSAYQMTLKKGRNFVSIPLSLTATAASNSILNLLGSDGLAKIDSLEYFDTATDQWLIYAPFLPEPQDLQSLANATAFYLYAKEDTTITVLGVTSDFLAPSLAAGWNAVGVVQPITVSAFAAGVAGFDVNYDHIYRIDEKGAVVALQTTDTLERGEGYWLDNDPDEDGVQSSVEIASYGSSPALNDLEKNAAGEFVKKAVAEVDSLAKANNEKVIYLAEQCSQIYNPSLPKSLDALYEECKKWVADESAYTLAGANVTLGGFTISHVRYQLDSSGKKIEGIGLLQPWEIPESLSPLFSLNQEEKLVLNLKDENVLSASGENPDGFTIGGSNGLSFAATQLDYLSIDAEGNVESGLTATVDNLPERNYFVRWSPPRQIENQSTTNFIQLSLLLGDEDAPGDELTASRVWYVDTVTRQVLALENGDKKWQVNLPASAGGVFEPFITAGSRKNTQVANAGSPFTYKDPAAGTAHISFTDIGEWPTLDRFNAKKFTWLPVKATVNGETITFTGHAERLELLSAMGADLPALENQELSADESGRIATSGSPTWGFEKGAMFVAIGDGVQLSFKGWKLGGGLKWNPAVTLYLEYTSASVLNQASFSASVAPAVALKLVKGGLDGFKTSLLGGGIDFDGNLTLKAGDYQVGVNAEYAIKQQQYYATATEQKKRRSTDERLKLSVDHSDLAMSMAARIKQQYIVPDVPSLSATNTSSREGFQEEITLTGEGSYTLPDGIPVVGGKAISAEYKGTIEHQKVNNQGTHDYKAHTSLSAAITESSDTVPSDGGWNFSIDELRVDLEDVAITGVNSSKEAIMSYLTPSRPKGIKKINGYVTLTPPANFIAPGPFAAAFTAERVPQEDATTIWRGFVSADLDLDIPLDGASNFIKLKQLIGMKQGVAQWGMMILAELHLGERVIEGTLIYDAGTYTFIAQGYRLDDTFTSVDVIVSLTKGTDGKWLWTAVLGGTVSGQTVANLLGQDGSGVTTDLLLRGTLSGSKLILQVDKVPFNWGGLPEWIVVDNLRNIIYTREKKSDGTTDWSFSLGVDVRFTHFATDQSKAPTFNMTATYSPNGLTIQGSNLGPIDLGNGAQLTIVAASVGFGSDAETNKSTKVSGTMNVTLPANWRQATAPYFGLPENVSGSFEYSQGGFLARVVLAQKEIPLGGGKSSITTRDIIFKKASPWASGLESSLTFFDTTIEGKLVLGAKPRFVPTSGQGEVNLDLTGGYKVTISNLAVELASGFAMSGDAVITMPTDHVLNGIVGNSFAAKLSGSPEKFTFSTDTNITSSLAMGLLGTASFTITNLALSSDGAFAGSGSITLAKQTTSFVIGTTVGGGVYFTADFGATGIDLQLAQIFMLKIKNKIGLESLGPYQYVRIDDMKAALGDSVAGAELATSKFLYFLPSALPPAGFAFFDNLDGKVSIAGFSVGLGLSFPAPRLNDIGPVMKVLAQALSADGTVNLTPLETLSAPELTLRDVYMAFPKVAGVAWKDGRLQQTDNLFASLFGSDKLTLVSNKSLTPKDFVQIVTADSPMDIIAVAVPESVRQGSVNMNLLGFNAAVNYDLKEDKTLYEEQSVAKLADISKFIGKVRYVDQNDGGLPAELQGSGGTVAQSTGTSVTGERSTTVNVPLPADQGGGTATVTWTVEDITAELTAIKAIVAAITPPQNATWQSHFSHVWNQFAAQGLTYSGNRATFNYSPTISAELVLTEYDGILDITGIKIANNQLSARFGSATLYADRNFAGTSLAISNDVSYDVLDAAIGNDKVSSVKIEGRGKITLYRDAEFHSPATEVSGSLDSLDDSAVRDDDASSVIVYYPVAMDKVTGWRLILKSNKGIVTTVDAGGIEVVFPGDQKVLGLLPNGRMFKAIADTRSVLDDLQPYPALQNNAGTFLTSFWATKVLPIKSNYIAGADDLTANDKPVEFRKADGSIIGFQPLVYGTDKKVSGVRFDKETGVLTGKYGKITLYGDGSYGGKNLLVEEDIPDLGETEFGNDSASSIKVEDGGKATLYSGTNYTERWYYDYRSLAAKHSGKCLDVAGYSGATTANIQQYECNDADNQKWMLTPKGDDYYELRAKHSGKCMDVAGYDTGNMANIFQYDCNGADNQKWKLISKSTSYYQLQAKHSGRCADVQGGSGDSGANILQYDCHDGDNQKWKLDLAKVTFSTTAFEANDDWLGNNGIGNDKVRSVKVFNPLDISSIKEWRLQQSTPSGGIVTLAYSQDTEDNQYKTVISTELQGTGNRLFAYYDTDNGNALNIKAFAGSAESDVESGAEFPLTNYRAYVKGTPYDLADITDAAQYIRVVTRTIELADSTKVVMNADGGFSGTYQNVALSPVEGGSAITAFTLAGPDNMSLKFNSTKTGGIGSAEIVGSNPVQYTPLYRDNSGVPQGIKKAIGTVDGGFFLDATLSGGMSNAVQVTLKVSGAIQTNGNFYLTGNGDLIIANYKVSKAVVELSSEKGLHIRGVMDLYTAKVDIEGYLKPDGVFSFTGVAQVMASGTGVKGSLAVNNSGVNINGNVFIANKKITSGIFAIKDDKVSWTTDVSIGYAGFKSTISIALGQPGAGYAGRAYINLNVPLYVWGPKGWKCKRRWGIKICWPSGWGNIRVGTLPLHYNQVVGGSVGADGNVSINLGPATLKVDMAKPSVKASW